MAGATDVARQKALAADLLRRGVPRTALIGILILDFAARAPELSQEYVLAVEELQRSGRLESADDADLWKLFQEKALAHPWRTFWLGPTRLHMQSFLRTVDMRLVARVAQLLGTRGEVFTTRVLPVIKRLRHFDTYIGFGMLRSICEAASVRLRRTSTDASSMSLHTALMAQVLPFGVARLRLRHCARHPLSDGILAYVYCETTKLLLHEAILAPLQSYRNKTELFAEALLHEKASALLVRLRKMVPEEDDESRETALVNQAFPVSCRQPHNVSATLKRWKARLKQVRKA
jgi:hypothetical protein